MKKTLHGKRHLRARASVSAGREKRRFRKLMREMDAFAKFVNIDIPRIISKLVPQMIEAVNVLGQAIAKFGEAMGEMIPIIAKRIQERADELQQTKEPS